MGGDVSSDLLDIFAGSTERVNEPDPEEAPATFDPMADFLAAAAVPGINDVFDGVDPFQVYEVSELETNKLLPFRKAYKYTKPAHWDADDDIKFYKALRAFGTDLFLIGSVLKKFNAMELKRKLHREMRENHDLVRLALDRRLALTTNAFVQANGPIDPSKHFDMETLYNKVPTVELKQRRNVRSTETAMGDRKPTTNVFDGLFEAKGETKNEAGGIIVSQETADISQDDLHDLFGM
eukprot:Protomagalhaensia_sp_Gyna_25__762@NODE_1365_length_1906_cov_4_294055_g1097_i0_p1_GENE_NODE_1365_length_1906_cov_4_294055_g1097_i0NODE_1365_length_1906_cov_4_294055_g1097_i0_p1_ORF_typecomplete_len237_score40_39Myb_DNAbind_7/PF15963_5/2_1e14Myb_DNAbind_7/PF15963_5/5_6e03_NODE_1365_length_1906_cov_4_294055_g1097_i051761